VPVTLLLVGVGVRVGVGVDRILNKLFRVEKSLIILK
jgi:hypothetical protein